MLEEPNKFITEYANPHKGCKLLVRFMAHGPQDEAERDTYFSLIGNKYSNRVVLMGI